MQDILSMSIADISLQTILIAIALVVIGIALASLLVRLIKKVLTKTKLDDSLKGVIAMVIRMVLYVMVLLLAADYIGIPITSLLAVLSIAGLAVSLAIQDTLANVFSGILLLAAKTFSSGDYVEINSLEGHVTKVDLMNTYLRTADNKDVRIPNKDVQAAPIVNYSREPLRRVEIRVTASYDAPTERVKAALLDAADHVPTVLSEPAPFVGLQSYQNSAIEYVIRVWTVSDDYWTTYYTLNETIRTAFDRAGITMTYDHLNVHMQ